MYGHFDCIDPELTFSYQLNRGKLFDNEKVAYINAIKCLQTKPSKTQHLYPGARSRYDDYGSFHPWHRMMVRSFESDLRELCGYTGAQPYWDWSLDADLGAHSFVDSPVFRVNTAFGGNGQFVEPDSSSPKPQRTGRLFPDLQVPDTTGGGCVNGGPFANVTVNLGPGTSLTHNPRCLTRDFAPDLAITTLNSTVVEWALSASTFAEFDLRVQGSGTGLSDLKYATGGHFALGGNTGDLGSIYSSPSDPLFYLHYANIDRLWDKWQRAKWESRKGDISGPDAQFGYPWDFGGGEVSYRNVTLDYRLDFVELLSQGRYVTVGEVMDTAALCYRYSE
ncbi:hypothetical protein B0T16DRAFT_494448 [Cercophora newfieldiana]|uniref:Tyrosinase copper-binding domain-containing protein n=1 Tax=Cercophora newfieldiana TaxID=92897 RepID=A0AA39XZX7_9PEZI|nr:hypothetical protein B0T16DRAFT_494448 [Cercophora newfieldiana]